MFEGSREHADLKDLWTIAWLQLSYYAIFMAYTENKLWPFAVYNNK